MTWAVFLMTTEFPVLWWGTPEDSQTCPRQPLGFCSGRGVGQHQVLVQDQALSRAHTSPPVCWCSSPGPSRFSPPLCHPLLPRHSAGRTDHVLLLCALWAKSDSWLNHLLTLFKTNLVLNPWQPRGQTGRGLGDHPAEQMQGNFWHWAGNWGK